MFFNVKKCFKGLLKSSLFLLVHSTRRVFQKAQYSGMILGKNTDTIHKVKKRGGGDNTFESRQNLLGRLFHFLSQFSWEKKTSSIEEVFTQSGARHKNVCSHY